MYARADAVPAEIEFVRTRGCGAVLLWTNSAADTTRSKPMTAVEIANYIRDTFSDVEITSAYGYTLFFVGPDRQLPFATLAEADNAGDAVSNLNRSGVFRLNIGVSRETYRSFFGPDTPRLGPKGIVDSVDDFTVLDQILPHPHYAPQSWVCVLSPGPETFRLVKTLLQEAYLRAQQRAKRRAAHPQ
jgi:hypothetical protein